MISSKELILCMEGGKNRYLVIKIVQIIDIYCQFVEYLKKQSLARHFQFNPEKIRIFMEQSWNVHYDNKKWLKNNDLFIKL